MTIFPGTVFPRVVSYVLDVFCNAGVFSGPSILCVFVQGCEMLAIFPRIPRSPRAMCVFTEERTRRGHVRLANSVFACLDCRGLMCILLFCDAAVFLFLVALGATGVCVRPQSQ